MNFLPEAISDAGNMAISYSPPLIQFGSSLYCIHHGHQYNGELWYSSTSNLVNWTPDAHVTGIQLSFAPSLTLFLGSIWAIYHGGTQSQGSLHYVKFNGSWSTNTQVYIPYPEYQITESPTSAVFNNLLYVAYQGRSTGAGKVVLASTSSDSHSGWSFKFVPGVTMTGSPAMAAFNGKIYIVFGNSALGYGAYYVTSTDTNTWTSPALISNVQLYGTPSLVVSGNKLVLGHLHPYSGKLHIATCDTLGVWTNDQIINTSNLGQEPSIGVFNGKVVSGYTVQSDAQLHYVVQQ
eukprot:gene5494-6845_t